MCLFFFFLQERDIDMVIGHRRCGNYWRHLICRSDCVGCIARKHYADNAVSAIDRRCRLLDSVA